MASNNGGVIGSKLAVAVTTAIITTVVVAGGIALASVPNNSVNSGKIVNNTIRTEDIRNNTIKGIDIRDGNIGYADLGGGIRPRMARVVYNAGVASITAQRGGVTIVSEPFTGAVRLDFGRNMNSCAVTATANTGGVDASVRRSTTGGGSEVVVVIFDIDGIGVEEAFDIIAQC